MFDAALRPRLAGPLDRWAALLDRRPITPDRLTAGGLVLGLASAGLAAGQLWWWALACWLVSRVLDGLDGALARRRAARGIDGGAAGGFADITADFVVYGTSIVGIAIGVAGTDGGSWLPFAAVLLAYYVNGAAFLAFSSIAERTGHRIDDGRSLSFLGGLAEGTETIVAHTLLLALWPWAPQIAWGWAVVVAISATQRMVGGYRTLRAPAPGTAPTSDRVTGP